MSRFKLVLIAFDTSLFLVFRFNYFCNLKNTMTTLRNRTHLKARQNCIQSRMLSNVGSGLHTHPWGRCAQCYLDW